MATLVATLGSGLLAVPASAATLPGSPSVRIGAVSGRGHDASTTAAAVRVRRTSAVGAAAPTALAAHSGPETLSARSAPVGAAAREATAAPAALTRPTTRTGPAAPIAGATAPATTPAAGPGHQAPAAATTPAAPPTPGAGSDPLAGASWYAPHPADVEAAIAAAQAAGQTTQAVALGAIADHENATWLTGAADTRQTVADVAADAGASVPVLVLYAIPDRDCGGYSSGGQPDAAAYAAYVAEVAAGLDGHRAVVVAEPDALAEGVDCLTAAGLAARESMIAGAVTTLSAAGALVYIDAGNADWQSPATMAPLLAAAGVVNGAGFALDTSGFGTTATEDAYGNLLSAAVGGRHFVVDTSRNGLGGDVAGGWCNPPGEALGVPATTTTGDALADADLWLKVPGESDGTCNGGPAAGQWWTSYAVGLAERAGY